MKNAVVWDIKTQCVPQRRHYVSAAESNRLMLLRFEVFTAVAMKNDVFWDVRPYGSCKNRRFGGT
jgi:hypothetical protein